MRVFWFVCFFELAVPIAIETSGVFGPEATSFFKELARRIKIETGEPRSFHFLVQRIAVAIQRGNAAAVLGTMPDRTFILYYYFLYHFCTVVCLFLLF